MAGDGMAPGAGGLVRYVNRQQQDLGTIGTFEMPFGQPFSSFLCRFIDSTGAEVNPSSVRVRLGLGALDVGGNMGSGNQPILATIRDIIDPLAFPVFWIAGEDVRKLYVHVVTATAGILLEVTGIQGGAYPRFPSAAEIAAAIVSASAGAAQLAMSAPAPVVMGAASAVIVVANANRKYLSIQNVGVVDVFYRLAAAAAVVADNQKIPPGGEREFPRSDIYTGEVRGITGGAAGAVVVQEGV